MAGVLLILPFIVGFVIYFIILAAQRWPGMRLRQQFDRMGSPVGRSLKEITRIAGEPQSTSHEIGGQMLCQWIASNYHIALMFNGDECVEIVRVIRQ